MSIIAIRWAYSQPIKNPIEKSILVFLASHDFPGNTCVFKIKTIANAVSCSEETAITAIKRLHEKNYINKEPRFSDEGRQLTNGLTVLVPHAYVQKWNEVYDNLSTEQQGGGDLTPPSPPGLTPPSPPCEIDPYKNNNNKLNLKKSFYNAKDQKAANEKKHDFAPMMNEQKHIKMHENRKSQEMRASPEVKKDSDASKFRTAEARKGRWWA